MEVLFRWYGGDGGFFGTESGNETGFSSVPPFLRMSGIPVNASFLVILRKGKGEYVSGMVESGASRSAAETNGPG
jgi:hypothetical protein